MSAFNCPSNEKRRDLTPHTCTCPHCGKEQEFFSDELEKELRCRSCKKPLDRALCVPEA